MQAGLLRRCVVGLFGGREEPVYMQVLRVSLANGCGVIVGAHNLSGRV